MRGHHGHFAWYELLTTDRDAAGTFYAEVVGWSVQDASTPELAYSLFSNPHERVAGLMELPPDARKMGATPRWMGYVGVDDVDAAADLISRRGGAVYVPPTNSNIGRIAVVADPQAATLAVITGWRLGQPPSADPSASGHVGWHELLAVDGPQAFGFYADIFGWHKAEEAGSTQAYQLFAADGQTIGGILTKRQVEPIPFWLYYFNTADIDAATARARSRGGQLFEGPIEVPGDRWIARYIDPQGAIFALQGQRTEDSIRRDRGSEVGWSAEWRGISSRGRLVKSPRR